MKLIKFLPIIIGGAGVIQAGLNKAIAETCGLSAASLVNGIVVALWAAAVFLFLYHFPGFFSDFVSMNKEKGFTWHWWYVIPGTIGFCFVFFIPLIIKYVGTLPVFLGIIAGQIIVSIFWDAFYENIPVSSIRIFGALLTFAGALLAVWRR